MGCSSNMANWGLFPLTYADSADYDKLEQGDEVTLETVKLKEDRRYVLCVPKRGLKIKLISPLCKTDLDSIKAGGRLNQVKTKLGESE